jgi:hypothetical protein
MRLFKILGQKLGLWQLAYLTGTDGTVLLRVIRRNEFDENYCDIYAGIWTVRLLPGGVITGIGYTRWMHYDVAQRLAEAVVEGLRS